MKKRLLIPLLVFLSVAGVGIAFAYWPRTVPWEECSALYRQYAHADGIEATFLRGYRVNDTLSIDVTLLQATDSAGWDKLSHDFSIKHPEDSCDIAALEAGGDILGIVQNSRINIELEQTDIAISSYRDRYVSVFHTKDNSNKSTIRRAILSYKVKQLKNQQ